MFLEVSIPRWRNNWAVQLYFATEQHSSWVWIVEMPKSQYCRGFCIELQNQFCLDVVQRWPRPSFILNICITSISCLNEWNVIFHENLVCHHRDEITLLPIALFECENLLLSTSCKLWKIIRSRNARVAIGFHCFCRRKISSQCNLYCGNFA